MIQQKCVATRQPWAQWWHRGDDDVLCRDCLCESLTRLTSSVVIVGFVVALLLFLLLLSLLSSSPFGVIVTAVAAIITIVLVAPAPVALAVLVVDFPVIATTFLALDAA